MADALRPPTFWQRWTAGDLAYDAAIALLTAILAILGGYRYLQSEPPEYGIAVGIAIVAIGVVGLQIAKAIHRNARALKEAHVHSLDGALHLLHAQLSEQMGVTENGALRVCVFVPVKDDYKDVFQATDYVGTDTPYGRRRQISSVKGIVGKALRTNLGWYDSLPSGAQVVDHLVSNYGFSREEAGQMQQDRRSWAALPIQIGNRVVAVLYLDSSMADAFGRKDSPRRRLIQSAVLGVAQFLLRSYD